jgi:uncharacterized membrane protein
MNKIEIYVSEVVKYLPRHLKEEVREDLTSQLLDMIEDENDNEDAVKVVLEKMGSPKALADNYLNRQKSLIGPRYYETYTKILKIVLFALILAFSITFAIKLFFSDFTSLWIFLEFPLTLFNAALMGFAYVTLIFVIIERNEVKIDDEELDSGSWTIKDLPQESIDLPSHRLENVFEIGFVSILMFIINLQPNLIGIYSASTNQGSTSWTVTPILNELTRPSWIWLVNVWLVLMLMSGVIKAIYRLGEKKRLLYSIVFDTLSLSLFVFIALTQKIFVADIAGLIAPGNQTFALLIERGTYAILAIIIISSLYEIVKRLIHLKKLKA